ncbi:histidine phosphatase family protein [Fictibacillus fluitans]|uniref:Histidine phosphatase family protein n=1 Tax=Fictibacillus fluitans TaxID=3058422 RepID=A0ABT8HYB1_9BACL|nr:histidine phosphatase family protein [Fictibacillus sp. NE201]MDN4525761.1 histidine phosphatase family protein [Fictibacillus sp. NE201]
MARRVAVTLLRHGLTLENQQKKYIGFSDPLLCEEGRNELRELHEKAGFLPSEAILSSDRNRCVETAEILFPGQRIIASPALRELHFGEWENKTYAELCHDLHYRAWIDDPSGTCPPGGEHFHEFEKRLLTAWQEEIWPMAEQNGHVTVVTHGGPIRFYLSVFASEPKEMWEWHIPHGKGYALDWNENTGRFDGKCTLLQEAPSMVKPSG